jgi:hypothetical protein
VSVKGEKIQDCGSEERNPSLMEVIVDICLTGRANVYLARPKGFKPLESKRYSGSSRCVLLSPTDPPSPDLNKGDYVGKVS